MDATVRSGSRRRARHGRAVAPGGTPDHDQAPQHGRDARGPGPDRKPRCVRHGRRRDRAASRSACTQHRGHHLAAHQPGRRRRAGRRPRARSSPRCSWKRAGPAAVAAATATSPTTSSTASTSASARSGSTLMACLPAGDGRRDGLPRQPRARWPSYQSGGIQMAFLDADGNVILEFDAAPPRRASWARGWPPASTTSRREAGVVTLGGHPRGHAPSSAPTATSPASTAATTTSRPTRSRATPSPSPR